jgi:hypothetical protein
MAVSIILCKQHRFAGKKNIRVLGWVFNDQYMDYEEDIVRWSGYPKTKYYSKIGLR